jgi:hypothetical protein
LTTDLSCNLRFQKKSKKRTRKKERKKRKKKEKKRKKMAYFVVRQTSSGEDGNLLATGNGVHGIDGGDTSLDHLLRVNAGEGVNGLT